MRKKLQLSDKEGPISADRKIRVRKKWEVMDQLLNDSHWLNDLDFLFEGRVDIKVK